MAAEFITKDSGEHKEYESGMQRGTNKGKPRYDLLVPLGVPYDETMLYRWAMLMQRGSQVYSARNWEKASGQEELDRFKESAFRHFMQWFSEEDDEDHAAGIIFGINGYETTKYKMKQAKDAV